MILLLLLLIPTVVFAEVEILTGIENLSEFSDKTISVANDNMKLLNGNVNKINTVLGNRFINTILQSQYGGTGANLGSVPANNIPYFSSTGTMGNIGIGTTGQYLTYYSSAPTWTTLTQNISEYNTTSPTHILFSDWIVDNTLTGGVATFRSPLMGRGGTVRVGFYARAINGSATGQAYIRKNGIQVGTTQNLTSSFSSFEEDFSVSAGDYFDLYLSVCTNNCYLGGFWISAGNVVPEHGVTNDGAARRQPEWKYGTGAPTSIPVPCSVGDLFSNLTGSTSTTLYVCTATNTWTAK